MEFHEQPKTHKPLEPFADILIVPTERVSPFASHAPAYVLIAAALLSCLTAVPVIDSLFSWGFSRTREAFAIAFVVTVWSIVCSAVGYLTIWITLGPDNFGRRCLFGWGALLAGTGCWLIGLATDNSPPRGALFPITALIVWTIFCLQLPFWALRYVLGRRLIGGSKLATPEKWSLRDWGVGTILFSAALALSRTLFDSPWGVSSLVGVGVFVLIATLVYLPAALLLLTDEYRSVRLPGMLIHILFAQSPLGVLFILRRAPQSVILVYVIAVCVMCLAIYGGMWALRKGGYRLIRGTSVRDG